VNSDGDFEKARQNCIELVKWLMPQVKLGSDKVVRHYDASGKRCPANMLNKPELWNDLFCRYSAPAGTQIIANQAAI
jgi:N-acetylmuramoyl-L-alanine amidase CwlA